MLFRGPRDAQAAAEASTLGEPAKRAFQALIDRYQIAFTRALFLPADSQPASLEPVTSAQARWQAQVDAVRRRFPKRAAGAPEWAEVPDLSHVYVVEVPEEYTESAAAALADDPHVEYAHLDYVGQIASTPLPNVSFVPNDYYVKNGSYWREASWGQAFPDLWGLQKIQAIEAWNQFAAPATDPGHGVVVAVLDTGLDYTHADIVGNVWINPGEDINHNGVVDGTNMCPVVNGDFNCVDDDIPPRSGYVDDLRGWNFVSGTSDTRDDHLHGTHVSGTIAAIANNAVGIAGVAPNARIMPVKIDDSAGEETCTNAALGITYMTNMGAKVNNNSWVESRWCQALLDAVHYAYSQGVVMVAAAGNDGRNALVRTPASEPDVITVAAFDQNDQPTIFTNFGSKIDVAAPGGGPGSILDPSILNVLSLLASGVTPSGCLTVGSGYCRTAGTSMATPHVAGVAALILSLHPTYTVEQVRQALRMSADDVGATGWDPDSGFGRVNALRAVSLPAPPTSNLLNISHEQSVFDVVPVSGQIGPTGMALQRWTLSYRAFTQTTWTVIQQVSSPTPGSISSQWDVRQLPIGAYLLQLEVQNASGQRAQDLRRVYRSVYEDVSGTNLPAASQSTDIQNTRSIAVGDVNRDGSADLVICNLDRYQTGTSGPITQQLWINDGAGRFTDQSATRLPARQFACFDVALTDVNRDGAPDIVYVAADGSGNRLWMNDGQGNFTDQSSARLPSNSGVGSNTGGIAVGDINGDGAVDLILTTNPPALLVNDGSGNFSDQTASRMPWLAGCTSCGNKLVDLNRDGYLDFIYTNGVGMNDGTGHFSQGQGSFTSVGNHLGLAVSDLNGDGFPDVAVGGFVFYNNGQGGFTSSPQSLVSNPCALASSVADINLDLHPDVMFSSLGSAGSCKQQDIVLLDDGTGRFTDQSAIWGFVPTFTSPEGAVFADVTGDGYPDLIFPGVGGSPTALQRARWDQFPPACVDDCNGNGSVSIAELQRAINITLGTQPVTACRAADPNGNGEVTCAEINMAVNTFLSGCPRGGAAQMTGASGLASPLTGGTITQQIGSASGTRGSDITIPVSITGGGGIESATQVDLLFSTAVLSNPRCSKNPRLTNHSLSTSLPSNPLPPAGQTRLRTLLVDTNAASTFTDGGIFSCTFTINPSSPTGTFPISCQRQHVSDHPGNELTSTVTNGSVTVF